MIARYDCYTVASKINQMTVKTEPGDEEKIKMIYQLINQNVDIDRIIQRALPSGTDSRQLPLPMED
jgi:BioD-like phosphotransacetylase family protein